MVRETVEWDLETMGWVDIDINDDEDNRTSLYNIGTMNGSMVPLNATLGRAEEAKTDNPTITVSWIIG